MPTGYENYADGSDVKPEFSSGHTIAHSNREFFLTFGQIFPPDQKMRVVSKLVLTKEHMVELMHNIGMQLKKFEEEKGNPGSPGPGRV